MDDRKKIITLVNYPVPKNKSIGNHLNDRTSSGPAEKLKHRLRGKWPEINTADVNYDVFVESISECYKTRTNLTAVKTEFGDFAISKTPPEEVIDESPAMMNIGYDGRKIVIPVEDSRMYIFAIRPERLSGKFEIKTDELDLNIDVDYSQLPDRDVTRLVLSDLCKAEVAAILGMARNESISEMLAKLEKNEIVESKLFGVYCVYVETDVEKHRIYLREDKYVNRTFNTFSDGGANVAVGNRKYSVFSAKKKKETA